jgi:hypothetical protein
MEAVVEQNLFTRYRVGEQDSVVVSHLQFVDDTLLLGVKSWANVCALRLAFWDLVMTRLKNKLYGWKSRFLSFGGRLVLLKSVLTSLLGNLFAYERSMEVWVSGN